MIGADVSLAALAGAPIEVALCDAYLKPIKVLPQTTKLTFRKGELYYTAPVTEQEAHDVGKVLVDLQFFSDELESLVHLSRDGDANQLRFVVNPSRGSDPAVFAAFATLGGVIAENARRQPARRGAFVRCGVPAREKRARGSASGRRTREEFESRTGLEW